MLLPASEYVGASAFTWPAALFLWGPGSWTDLHRPHCVQLVKALDGTLRFRQWQRQRWATSTNLASAGSSAAKTRTSHRDFHSGLKKPTHQPGDDMVVLFECKVPSV